MAIKPKGNKVNGTKKNDKITWSNSKAWKKSLYVYGLNGNDTINFKKSKYKNKLNGGNGNDKIWGGTNIDSIYGNSGNDSIYGMNGNDKIWGGTGKDTIYGGNGNDSIKGGDGNDKLYGEKGKDTIYGDKGNDYISGGDSDDKLYGGDGNDTILGGDGNDKILGGNGNDTISGGNGNDYIESGNGNNSISGGNGNDTIITGISGRYTIDGGSGNDLIKAGDAGNTTIKGGSGRDTIYGSFYNDSIDGGSDNDIIYGGEGNNTLYGGSGDDIIYASGGSNTINGGLGMNEIHFTDYISHDHVVLSGGGEDYLYFDNQTTFNGLGGHFDGNDLIFENFGNIILKDYKPGGHSAKYIVINGESRLISELISDDLTIDLSAQDGNATIQGCAGNDNLTGGSGNDVIYGGSGNDTINAGLGTNSIYFYSGNGQDVVQNGNGTDTLVFEDGTDVYLTQNNDDLIVHYGNSGDMVTIENYNSEHSVQNIKIGNTEFSINDFHTLTRGNAINSLNITSNNPAYIILANPFGGENYTYKIETTSNTSQTVNLNFLSNGRLRIEGNYLNITAGSNQADDIILWGNCNTISTNDLDDIVRLGCAVDSGGPDDNYCVLSNQNTVNTGTGDDYVVYFGHYNVINGGEGNDTALSLGSPLTNVTSEIIRDIDSNTANSQDGVIGWFNQGSDGGDCRLLSLIQSLSNALPSINKSYSDFVSITAGDNGYTVTFNNYDHEGKLNSVEITSDELDGFAHVNGDLDVVLTDLALNKLIASNQDHDKTSVMTARYNTLSDYFFGNEQFTYILSNEENYSDRLVTLWNQYSNGTISNLTVGITAETDTNYELGLISSHAYVVTELNDSYISLVNVWDSSDVLNLGMDTFNELTTAAFVYGYDYFNENRPPLENVAGSFNTSDNAVIEITQDVIGWQEGISDSGIQNLYDSSDGLQINYLAINSIQDDNIVNQFAA